MIRPFHTWLFLSFMGCSLSMADPIEVPLPFAGDPGRIAVDDNAVFIIDGHEITILSRDDFRVLHTFGRQGEGPGEFNVHPNDPPGFSISADVIVISAEHKVLEFDKSGNLIRETRSGLKGIASKPYKGTLVSMERFAIAGDNSVAIQYYDNEMHEIKIIYQYEDYYVK